MVPFFAICTDRLGWWASARDGPTQSQFLAPVSYARNRCLSQIFQLLKEKGAGTAESAKPVYKKFVILKQRLRRTLVPSLMPVMVMKFIVIFAVRPAYFIYLSQSEFQSRRSWRPHRL
jgi:hypothetical protein